MRSVHLGPAAGLVAQLALLGALAATVGLGTPALVVGTTYGLCLTGALDRGLTRRGAGLGPADRVTLTRATLVGAVTALTVESLARPVPVWLLVSLAAVALALDAVDGFVARRTGTGSPLGARFDMEVDAFLILVLSIYVAPSIGVWVLLIGAARYLLGAAAWAVPWLRQPVPPRYWRKVVAAVQGIVLTVAAAAVLPSPVSTLALLGALALLTESFGRDVWWLSRHRVATVASIETEPPAPPRGRARTVGAGVLTVLAASFVWVALVSPDAFTPISAGELLRIPVEGLVLVGVALVLHGRARRVTAVVIGLVLSVLAVVRVLDVGFTAALGRPFNPVSDWGYLDSAVGLLSASIGRPEALVSLVAAGLLVLAVFALLPLSLLRVSDLLERHRRASLRTVTALAVVWASCFVLGLQVVPGTPLASASAGTLAVDQVRQAHAGLEDEQTFARESASDPFGTTPGYRLLTGLRGKDVLVVFVESYGRVAIEGSDFSPQVDAVLDQGTRQLQTAGFGARSAYLTSPTFGGISWLAHSTFQSGLWVNSQQRYDHLVSSNRLTLARAFKEAGWRTVADVPSNERDWPEGRSFYGYDRIDDGTNVGYAGPAFSYASMPDQYTLSAFQRSELAEPHHAPVMAEIDLVSSHTPWTPLPRMVDWASVGDGSGYAIMPAEGQSPAELWRDGDAVRSAYGQSIEYSLTAVISFVRTYGDDNLVMVVLGDHQPATIVSGTGASHDVPVTVIAHDPAVLDQIAGWGWQRGLRPDASAPVWRMDAFRDRFLTAYSH